MDTTQLHFEKIRSSKADFFHAYELLTAEIDHHILLESGRGGKYSIAGFNPVSILNAKDNRVEICETGSTEIVNGDPLDVLYSRLQKRHMERDPELPDFQGGAMGFISYDYARQIERLGNRAHDDLEIPDLYYMIFSQWAVYDHDSEQIWLMADKEGAHIFDSYVDEWKTGLNRSIPEKNETLGPVSADRSVSMNEEQFISAVEKIQSYIKEGDVFQVNLSVRQSQDLAASPYAIYKRMRELNPSPYMSYVHTPHFQIASGSPELLVKKKGTEVSTRPIAGTRSRGHNEKEDQMLADELIHNEKERAEHVMLVDLERNDLGRVCQYGTVEVNEFMVIEKYSHVMHIVSNVRGTLANNKNGKDLIRAVFPGGTITGAPKVRTMEIIEELEPVRRGVYTGSIGWIGFNGDMELNIVIRTLFAKDGQAHIQAGAGVVIDSNPKHEYKESLKKAKAVWEAKELAEGADK
ncbi:aminodeoxychorismate synthase, component I [Rossellomorea vietnamensis]|uniref:Aminodeoxychorismate synthase, component I n=1 Tax=Rossellomorea vietnamensis TaxID=218284 RepID=A0A5D4NIN8_9BACI|nr:aminodeoxychorismate synthase, component I [Rossellomorea vietnamensis]TYS13679.1 aminodeoxychorismate synthase, component I [Rossellomorea vietnamensis]